MIKNSGLIKLISVIIIFSAFKTYSQTEANHPKKNTKKNSGISYTIIPSANMTWGYDIYFEKQLRIHQPTIPGYPGNNGFKTKADAKKVANRIIIKIKNGEMPPGITIEELKKLKVL
ncbi:MAG TPA: DUF4907 domain-containing protein [Bacteroidales bacterium]|nr:DUF4907 domain-containing protein [Bacteroidales bacterium]